YLEEQRRDEREQLQEERRDQHLAQEIAIFVDRAQKPGDVESAGDVPQTPPAGHEDQIPLPDPEQVRPPHPNGTGRPPPPPPKPNPRPPSRPPPPPPAPP